MGKRDSWYIDGMTGVVHCGSDIVSTRTRCSSITLVLPELCFVSFSSICSIVAVFQFFVFAIMAPSDHTENALPPPSLSLAATLSAESSKNTDSYELTDQTRYVSPSKIIMVC